MATTKPASGAWRRWQQRIQQKEERDTERNKEMKTGGVQSDKDCNDLLQLKKRMINTNNWHSCRRNVTKRPIKIYRTYLFTPWSRVLLEKLTGSQLIKKFPIFYGIRRLMAAFISARHPSLSCARSIQSVPSHPTFWRFSLILYTPLRLGFPSSLFPSGFPTKTLYTLILSPTHATCPAHLILLDLITRTILGGEYRSSSSLCSFLHSGYLIHLGPNILLSTLFSPSQC